MAFDPTTARPVSTTGFDLSTATPVIESGQETQPETEGGFFGASVIEPALTVASSIPAEIAGGLSTLLPLIQGNPDTAEANLNAIRELITYQPRTEEGQQGLASLGETMQPVSDVLQTVEDKFSESGAQTFEALGLDPAIGAGAGAALPEALGAVLGLGAAKKVTDVRVPELFTTQSKFKQKISEEIQSGGTDRKLAKYIVDGTGKVKADPIAKEAIKQGFDDGVIAAIKGATPSDKSKMTQMVDVVKRGKDNALYAAKNRPSDIAGNSLIERVNHVKSVNREAGQALDGVAKSLKGKTVDSALPINNFTENLNEMGISIGGDLKPKFRGSDVEGLAAPEAAIKNIVNRLSVGGKGKLPDAYELHRMKKYIDEIVTFGKAGEGLSGKTERILKQLRSDLDGTLDSNFPEYDKVNTTYADTIGALDDLQGVAGKKMNLFSANANKATGTLLRRLMSNAQSRVNLVDAVDSLEGVAKKYGADFDDDLATQMLFADELDSVFGAAAKTSLQGDVTKAVKAGQSARGKTLTDLGLDAAQYASEKIRNISDEGAINSIYELLKK